MQVVDEPGPVVVVAHDTTQFTFGGKSRAEAVGHLPGENAGFLGHFALGVSSDEGSIPLGVLAMKPIHREPAKRRTATERRADDRSRSFEEKESYRWVTLAADAEVALGGHPAIHVMDREADDYVLLAALQEAGRRFVVRSAGNRLLLTDEPEKQKLKDALQDSEDVLFRDVELNARTKAVKGKRPLREVRVARLHIRACRVTFPRPQSESKAGPAKTLSVNVVEVFEPAPPEGEEAIAWRLMTTEPIATPEDRARVVDFYRARWRIEEFFKALKTGCAYEKRQLESEHSLLNALAILVPVAWRLLLLRHLARNMPEEKASAVFSEDQLNLLRLLSKRVKLTAGRLDPYRAVADPPARGRKPPASRRGARGARSRGNDIDLGRSDPACSGARRRSGMAPEGVTWLCI